MSYLSSTTTLSVTEDLGVTLFPLGAWIPPNHIFTVDPIITFYLKIVGWFNGLGKVYGVVTATNAHVPVGRRKVRLHAEKSGVLVAETWCDSAGNYVFNNILETESYYVVAFDHTHTYADEIKSPVVPELM